MKTLRKLIRVLFGGGLILLALLLVFGRASADTVTVDFDSVDTSAGNVEASHYLAGFGVSLSDVTPGTEVIVYKPGAEVDPPSAPNVLAQSGSNDPVSFTLNFAVPLDSVGFTRPKLVVLAPSGITHPEWSAHAFDSGGVEVDTDGEAQIGSFVDVPAQTFTLTGPDIKSVRIDSDNKHFAAFSAVLIDDMTLEFTADECAPDLSGTWKIKIVGERECCDDPSLNGPFKGNPINQVTQQGDKIFGSWVSEGGANVELTGFVNGKSVYYKIKFTSTDGSGCSSVIHVVGLIKGKNNNKIKGYWMRAWTCSACKAHARVKVRIKR